MAKARPIPELGKDDAFASAAARVVEIRTRELVEHSEGVLDLGDIERLHDMRVATRRLRAALEVFRPCFPKKRFKEAHREVRALADALGERRDRDVTLEALDRFGAGLGAADRPGLRSLARSVRDEQADANLRLAPSVTAERVRSLEAQLMALVAAAGALVSSPELEVEPEPEVDHEPEPQAVAEPAPEADHEPEPQAVAEPQPPPPAAPEPPASRPAPAFTNGGEPR